MSCSFLWQFSFSGRSFFLLFSPWKDLPVFSSRFSGYFAEVLIANKRKKLRNGSVWLFSKKPQKIKKTWKSVVPKNVGVTTLAFRLEYLFVSSKMSFSNGAMKKKLTWRSRAFLFVFWYKYDCQKICCSEQMYTLNKDDTKTFFYKGKSVIWMTKVCTAKLIWSCMRLQSVCSHLFLVVTKIEQNCTKTHKSYWFYLIFLL